MLRSRLVRTEASPFTPPYSENEILRFAQNDCVAGVSPFLLTRHDGEAGSQSTPRETSEVTSDSFRLPNSTSSSERCPALSVTMVGLK